MDAVTLLTADHNRVRGLFARFSTAEESGDTQAMAALVDEIARELEVHTDIEETVFYPWSHDLSDEIADVVDEGLQEHHVAKVLLYEILAGEPGSDEWVAKVKVLMENVEHHASEEESELFPPVRGAARGELDDVAERLEARKAELGAPVLADKQGLTNEQLRELASAQEIPGRSSMDHDELAATVSPR
ncbi:MAG: hemerythrin domain-containing protein [Acidimicrobiales bacterium]|nr:hemerythrin domain-containing protein [Acidimicrobiales bacterium]